MTTSPNIILHLGLGAFHKAHQASYLQELYDLNDGNWSIIASNVRNDDLNGLANMVWSKGTFTLETIDAHGARTYKSITSIKKVIPWSENAEQLALLVADSPVKIISFTVTEAGYYLNSDNSLNFNHADIIADMTHGKSNTIYGTMTRILDARRQANGEPLTLLSCDNLQQNGCRFRLGFMAYLKKTNQHELLAWVNENTSMPNSVVDCITPKPTEIMRQRVGEAIGYYDANAVMSEAYKQWVIEDNFINGRPAWEKVGVALVDDVRDYENAKISMLNASHSCIGWAGALRGCEYIHEAINDPVVLRFTGDFLCQEVIPSLQPSSLDLTQYQNNIIERFNNASLADTVARICTDSEAKMAGFIVPTISRRIEQNQSIIACARVAVLYYLFLCEWHAHKTDFEYSLSVDDFVNNPHIFQHLAGNKPFASAVQEQLPCVQQQLLSMQKL